MEGGVVGADGGVHGVNAGVPVTDTAMEADRNATITSSGMGHSDSESPSSLFGDVAYGGSSPGDRGGATGGAAESDFASLDENEDGSASSTNDDFSQADASIPEFEEPKMIEEQFEDDETTFSTYDESESVGTEGLQGEVPSPDDEGPSLIRRLWDFFTDDE